MTPSDSSPLEIGKHPLDDTLIRSTAEDVRLTARRAHRVEIALVLIAALAMVVIAGFTGYNTHRLRDVNRTLEANQEALQDYNEAHSESAGQNFAALVENIRCFTSFFVAFNEAVANDTAPPDRAVLDACFKPVAPTPPPADLPSEDEDEKE